MLLVNELDRSTRDRSACDFRDTSGWYYPNSDTRLVRYAINLTCFADWRRFLLINEYHFERTALMSGENDAAGHRLDAPLLLRS